MKITRIEPITVEDVALVSLGNITVTLDDETKRCVQESHQRLVNILEKEIPVYGINTGFGIFASKTINNCDISKLNRNLILSHSVGTGEPLADKIVRAAMFIRAVSLSQGFSGIRLEVIQTILDMINKGVTPVVPCKGSLGSSGDLCQLSHMALVVSRDENDLEEESGLAKYDDVRQPGKTAMEKAGIERIILNAKEGLALNNGATFTAAIGTLSVYEAEYLLHIAEIAVSLSMEALCARAEPLDDRIHQSRHQTGQIISARIITKLLEGSTFINADARVQDAYSIRCTPQVHGAVRDTVQHVRRIIENEINAATDNPLIFKSNEALSGGNFHGEPLGMVMDFLAIAISELGAISERRTSRLIDEKTSYGLPPMLVINPKEAGLNSGLMMPHYTAVSLVLENQTLATPDSIRSLPTSAGQEDHNANAMTAARHAYEIIDNVRQILSIEIYTALRAIYLRKIIFDGILGTGTGKIYNNMKPMIQSKTGDTLWGIEIRKINDMIVRREF